MAFDYSPKYVYARGSVTDGVIVRRSIFSPGACTPEMSAEIQKNRDDDFVLVEVYPVSSQAVFNPHDIGIAREVSVELTEAIRQAIDRAGL